MKYPLLILHEFKLRQNLPQRRNYFMTYKYIEFMFTELELQFRILLLK